MLRIAMAVSQGWARQPGKGNLGTSPIHRTDRGFLSICPIFTTGKQSLFLRWPADPSRRGNHANPGWAGLANGYQAAGVGLVSVVPTAREVMRALGKSCR